MGTAEEDGKWGGGGEAAYVLIPYLARRSGRRPYDRPRPEKNDSYATYGCIGASFGEVQSDQESHPFDELEVNSYGIKLNWLVCCNVVCYCRYLGLVGVPPPLQQAAPAGTPGSGEGVEGNVIDDPELAEARAVCGSLPGLVGAQTNVCMEHPSAIRPIAEGARRGIHECQFQFRHERWNCSTNEREQSVFGYILERGEYISMAVMSSARLDGFLTRVQISSRAANSFASCARVLLVKCHPAK